MSTLSLTTSIQGLELREISEADSDVFYDLVQRNRVFLTRYGDYEELVCKTREEIRSEFAAPTPHDLRMGLWREEEFIGLLNMHEADPGIWVLGYWLGEAYTGRGWMTSACRALMEYVRSTRPVKEFWAGVRHANIESAALMERLNFSIYEELPDRKRYLAKR